MHHLTRQMMSLQKNKSLAVCKLVSLAKKPSRALERVFFWCNENSEYERQTSEAERGARTHYVS